MRFITFTLLGSYGDFVKFVVCMLFNKLLFKGF